MKCRFCGSEIEGNLEEHLKEWHFLSIQDYYEMDPLSADDLRCCKCGSQRFPLTYIEPEGFLLPHWDCLRPYEKQQYIRSVRQEIVEYYGRVGSDRFLQMFLIGDIYFTSTPSHGYQEFKDVLKVLEKPERNKIWFLDWKPGYPRTLSLDNVEGIKVVPINQLYSVKSEPTKITLNDITINFATLVPFDFRHHSRYNLFNRSPSARQVKRLRLKDEKDQCVRFDAPPDDSHGYSIFTLERGGQRIKASDLGELDLLVTKLILLRNKTFMKLIQSIFTELIQNTRTLSDSVFLKNTVIIGSEKESDLHFSWLPRETKKNFINISIL